MSLASRSTRLNGSCITRPTSRTAARACSEPSAMICPTRSRPYFAWHVAHHLVAPLLAEIDVEIRHRDAFGIEEALEHQAEPDGIEIGDVERPGDQRGRARAAHAHRNAVRARPFHEIRDDQEIAGKTHADDDAKLEFQAIPIGFLFGEEPVLGEPPLQPGLRLRAHFVGGRKAGFGHELRQDGIALLGPEGAAARDLDRVLDGFRKIGKERRHFVGALEAMFRRQTPAVFHIEKRAVGDAEQRVMRLIHVLAPEMHIIGRDQRQALGIGEDRSVSPRRRLRWEARAAAARHRAGRRTPPRAGPEPLRRLAAGPRPEAG